MKIIRARDTCYETKAAGNLDNALRTSHRCDVILVRITVAIFLIFMSSRAYLSDLHVSSLPTEQFLGELIQKENADELSKATI